METVPRVESLKAGETHFEIPEKGGTSVMVVRNGEDYRGKPEQDEQLNGGHLEIGSLMPESAEAARDFASERLNEVLMNMTDEEKKGLVVLVAASDARLGSLATSEDAGEDPAQRCVETASVMLNGTAEAMAKNGLNADQLLNTWGRAEITPEDPMRPMVIKGIEDMVDPEAAEPYFDFLKTKAAETGENPWALYEKDTYADVRETYGIQGPAEIAGRQEAFMHQIDRVSTAWHKRHPEHERILVLAVEPRDVMGPWLDEWVGASPDELPDTENFGGFSYVISPDGTKKVKVGGDELPRGPESMPHTPKRSGRIYQSIGAAGLASVDQVQS